jgi:hypothetical protein
MGVGTLLCPVQRDLQGRNFVWMVFCHPVVPILMKMQHLKLDMEQCPVFMRLAIYSPNFHEECTTLNNILSMAATKVCNYCNTPGFTYRGPDNVCVLLNGRVHHVIKTASSNNTHNYSLSYFIFDNSASHALSPESQNFNEQTLNDLAEGLERKNPYCMELRQLGLSVQHCVLSASVYIIPRMVDKSAFRNICNHKLLADWCYYIKCDNY